MWESGNEQENSPKNETKGKGGEAGGFVHVTTGKGRQKEHGHGLSFVVVGEGLKHDHRVFQWNKVRRWKLGGGFGREQRGGDGKCSGRIRILTERGGGNSAIRNEKSDAKEPLNSCSSTHVRAQGFPSRKGP